MVYAQVRPTAVVDHALKALKTGRTVYLAETAALTALMMFQRLRCLHQLKLLLSPPSRNKMNVTPYEMLILSAAMDCPDFSRMLAETALVTGLTKRT